MVLNKWCATVRLKLHPANLTVRLKMEWSQVCLTEIIGKYIYKQTVTTTIEAHISLPHQLMHIYSVMDSQEQIMREQCSE